MSMTKKKQSMTNLLRRLFVFQFMFLRMVQMIICHLRDPKAVLNLIGNYETHTSVIQLESFSEWTPLTNETGKGTGTWNLVI